MGDPVTTGLIVSSLVGAGSAQIQGQQARKTQRNLSAQRLKQQREIETEKRIASAREVEEGRKAESASSRLTKAKGQQIQASALRQRGIAPRPISSFSDIGRAVLDEGTVG